MLGIIVGIVSVLQAEAVMCNYFVLKYLVRTVGIDLWRFGDCAILFVCFSFQFLHIKMSQSSGPK